MYYGFAMEHPSTSDALQPDFPRSIMSKVIGIASPAPERQLFHATSPDRTRQLTRLIAKRDEQWNDLNATARYMVALCIRSLGKEAQGE